MIRHTGSILFGHLKTWFQGPDRTTTDRRKPNFQRSLLPTCGALEERRLMSSFSELRNPIAPQSEVAEVSRLNTSRPNPRPSFAGPVQVVRNVVYRTEGDRPEFLDLYVPSGPIPAGGRPVVIAIHGGGWRQFNKEHFAPKLASLTQLGYMVVAPNYTLAAPGRPSWPENFEDVRAAVRWVRGNAVPLGADPDRIGAIGESAGAHLATLLATYPDGPISPDGISVGPEPVLFRDVSARISGAIALSPPTDLIALVVHARGGAAAAQMLGGPPQLIAGRYFAASPLTHASADDPPILQIHGTADPIVPYGHSIALSWALSARGVPNRFVPLYGIGHGFSPFTPQGGAGSEVLRFLRDFV